MNNYRIESEELSKSIGIFIVIVIFTVVVLFAGYPRSLKGRLFIHLNDRLKQSFPVQSEEFALVLSGVALDGRKVLLIELDGDFADKETGMNPIGFSSLKNEKIRCFVDVMRCSEIAMTIEVNIVNTRTVGSHPGTNDQRDRKANRIEIDSDEVSGALDIIFRDFSCPSCPSCPSGKHDLSGIVLQVKVGVAVTTSRGLALQRSIGNDTKFRLVKN